MKKPIIILTILLIAITAFFGWQFMFGGKLASPAGLQPFSSPTPKPLDKYTIENLSKTYIVPSPVKIGELIKDDPAYISHYFFFSVDGKKVSGLINLPKTPGSHAIIVMFRGYVDKEIYATGIGTQRAGEIFAQNGFITLAPDFLGYGKSDLDAQDSIESRLQTYTTALVLLKSVPNLNASLTQLCHSDPPAGGEESLQQSNRSFVPQSGTQDDKVCGIQSDTAHVGIWAHSNGGQIALTVLETTGKPYPTVLWAPVSKPFPYNILYYTDDIEDHGKALRKVVANFENEYDAEKYSVTNYLQKVNAPLQLHQGTADDAVPQKWSDALAESLKKLNKNIEYFVYPGADHNLLGSWDEAVARSVTFYQDSLDSQP